MGARDELADILNSNHLYYDTGSHYELSTEDAADAILAAGYRKPRTITTLEELDALPAGTVIRDPLTCTKWGDGRWGTFSGESCHSNRIDLPAIVLWEPGR